MTLQPTPVAVHPDRVLPEGVLRDAPATDFLALMERSGATPDLLTQLRNDW
jgi:hypothetical protein